MNNRIRNHLEPKPFSVSEAQELYGVGAQDGYRVGYRDGRAKGVEEGWRSGCNRGLVVGWIEGAILMLVAVILLRWL